MTNLQKIIFWHKVKMAAMFIVIVIAIVIFLGYLFQHLWNFVMPDLFGLKEITMKQGFALMGIGAMLTGSSIASGRGKKK